MNIQTPVNDVWTEDKIRDLVRLYRAGCSPTEIARILETTKNAIIGKISRLGIARLQVYTEGSTSRPAITERFTSGPCAWPHGDPGTPNFRFCGEPSVEGKPYCAEHTKCAYLKPSSKGPTR